MANLDLNSINSGVRTAADLINGAGTFSPRPSGSNFSTVLRNAVEGVAGIGSNFIGGVSGNVFGDLKELLDLQVQTQARMQSLSMMSNIERSKHEARMAAIRNVRTG